MKNNILPLPALILLFLLWIIPGLVGREPWKADEPYSFNLVYHIIQSGDCVVPTLAGETFLEKPPLFFLTAAGFGRLFSPPLELYDATRLAAAFYMFLAFLFFALAAQELYGREYAAIAVILLLGCVHLQVTAHKLITDVSLFTGFSIAFYGLTLCSRRRTAGGFWIGIGTGIGFMSKGLLAPGVIGITAIALPVLFQQWRRKDYGISLAVSLAAMLPLVIIWPAALYRRSSDLFLEWFWHQNFGRFLGFAAAKSDIHSYYILNLPWLAWPAVLLALWALWYFRRSWREHPLFQVPLVAFMVMLVILSASSTNRALYAVPMLLPISLIAVPGIHLLPLKAKIIANRASVLFFGGMAILLWFGWFVMMIGSPAVMAQKLQDFQPDYLPSVNGALLAVAVLYSLAWLFIVIRVTRSPDFSVVNWSLGVVLAWGLVMTLWLPALNAGSSYRDAFTALKNSVPVQYSCIASRGLGESERGMLEYFTGIQTRRVEAFGPGDCNLLLEQRGGAAQVSAAGPAWQKIWEFRRPASNPKEIFTLYEKAGTP